MSEEEIIQKLNKQFQEWMVMARNAGRKEQSPLLHELKESVIKIDSKVSSIIDRMDNEKKRVDNLETKTEGIGTLKNLVYGATGIILISVVGAIMGLIIIK